MLEFGADFDSYRPVPVIYELRQSILAKIRNGEEEKILPDIDGREETKRDVVRAILSGANPYLVSEEGTGKTRLAKSLTRLLHPIPVIRGCPYHDDPRWGRDWLCPRCAESENPAEEYGVDFISGEERFSRIQGNEYTNYAKVLGLKDIEAIREGRSPTDPRVFTGTGVFHGNRGILFIADLPSIPTNVQVLLHPILEERKVILEEYNIERPIDFLLITTGNPEGFAHINKIPRPLLDRLELIPMDPPEKDVGMEIMLKERFKIILEKHPPPETSKKTFLLNPSLLARTVAVPWWIVDALNKTVRYTRSASNLDKGASIRGSNKALDHTCATVEMRCGKVACLRDVCEGTKLALRGRIRIRADLIDFEEKPRESFKKTDAVIEDVMRHATSEVGEGIALSEEVTTEINSMLRHPIDLERSHELKKMVDWMCSQEERKSEANKEEYHYSAMEIIVNTAVYRGMTDESIAKESFFIPAAFLPEIQSGPSL
jgi:MoxR-like ATPase